MRIQPDPVCAVSFNPPRQNLAVYIHWPFCARKCPYCDFNSHVRDQIDQSFWGTAYQHELSFYRHLTGPRRVTSVFFGGGTPSLMDADLVHGILDHIHVLWGIESETEITLEANPNSVDTVRFQSFRSAGINRVSIGIQSFDDRALRFLGRLHTADEGIKAIRIAQSIFEHYSFDLIYARPDQNRAAWELELLRALDLVGEHLSLYQLTIEPRTPFFLAQARGDFSIPDEEESAALYTVTDQIMERAGLPAYEVSNYARAGYESRHNLTYWMYGDYIGVGPGAHGRLTLNGVKYATRAHQVPEIWAQRVRDHGIGADPFRPVPCLDRGVEAVMMGLRLRAGLDLNRLCEETGQDWRKMIDPLRLNRLVENGDLIWNPAGPKENKIAPTLTGRLRLNQVIAYLLGG